MTGYKSSEGLFKDMVLAGDEMSVAWDRDAVPLVPPGGACYRWFSYSWGGPAVNVCRADGALHATFVYHDGRWRSV